MASTPQHRCVFVGNIPYDATEEQLIQICEAVGPVVSFRLVIDRETGKPKGYGFCEYKDEETALSARRNLQGYEINGRQLRVDFAENDKGADRNREQGRGGPGMAVGAEQKQIGAPVTPGDMSLLQPIGLPLAMTAASVMAGALGGSQTGNQLNQNASQDQLIGNDPLTLHLSKMTRNQLTQVISELKALGTQNKELARRLLLLHPQLPKAVFQAQIMLGMVTPQMLKMPNIRQAPGQMPQPSWISGQPGQQLVAPNPVGLPPLAPLSSVPSSHNPFSAAMQIPGQPRSQLPNPNQMGTLQQATTPGQSGAATIPSRTQPTGMPQTSFPVRSISVQRPVLQNPVQSGHGRSGQYILPAISGAQQSHVSRPMLPDHGYQIGSAVHPAITNPNNKVNAAPPHVMGDGPRINGRTANSNLFQESSDINKTSQLNRSCKLVKLDDGRGAPSSARDLTASAAFESGPRNAAELQYLDKQAPQVQFPPEMESALLQQVMNLTPEQLSSLPPEQQQQVLQLQQMFG